MSHRRSRFGSTLPVGKRSRFRPGLEVLEDRLTPTAPVPPVIIEPDTDRYLGRLCTFKTCPFEDKDECRVPGCGASRFLQQHEGFSLAPGSLAPEKIRVLFDRSQSSGAS